MMLPEVSGQIWIIPVLPSAVLGNVRVQGLHAVPGSFRILPDLSPIRWGSYPNHRGISPRKSALPAGDTNCEGALTYSARPPRTPEIQLPAVPYTKPK